MLKNFKLFRVSKNGVLAESNKKISNEPNNGINNAIRFELIRNNESQNQINNIKENININNIREENI